MDGSAGHIVYQIRCSANRPALFYSAMPSRSLHRNGADRKGFGCSQQVFCNAKQADVYTSALLAGAMKPLNVLSKFENLVAIKTVRFQVQLEADGYFSALKISTLQP